MAYLESMELAGYVSKKYHDEYEYEISPLKLQKTMYLLFAMWGGNARLANNDIQDPDTDDEKNKLVEYNQLFDELLFEPNFEAWKYGPVDRMLYREYREGNLAKVDELCIEDSIAASTIISFIDSICSQTFKINDFALVDLTHKDVAWQSKFNENDTNHCTTMNSECIIHEYASRISSR